MAKTEKNTVLVDAVTWPAGIVAKCTNPTNTQS